LEQAFRSPPDSAKPWAYWWWLNANVTKQSITRDLEEMKKKGLGGFLLFDVTAYGQHLVPSPPRRMEFMGPPWRQLVRHAMTEANRLGLEMSMNLSTCGGALRAPWKTGQQAPQEPGLGIGGRRRAEAGGLHPASPPGARSLGRRAGGGAAHRRGHGGVGRCACCRR
jgi:hypothetical protein